jgi:hypothetical protein
MFREFPVFTVLPNLRKKSLIYLLSILKFPNLNMGSVLLRSARVISTNKETFKVQVHCSVTVKEYVIHKLYNMTV